MNNKFDFKDLIQFGMFIIALLTFIYLYVTNLKNLPCTLASQEGFLLSYTGQPPCGDCH